MVYLTAGGDRREYLESLRLEGLDAIPAGDLLAHARRWAKPKIDRAIHALLDLERTAAATSLAGPQPGAAAQRPGPDRLAGAVTGRRSWRPAVRNRIASLDWAAAERDVTPFLEPGPETALFGRESLLKLLAPA